MKLYRVHGIKKKGVGRNGSWNHFLFDTAAKNQKEAIEIAKLKWPWESGHLFQIRARQLDPSEYKYDNKWHWDVTDKEW